MARRTKSKTVKDTGEALPPPVSQPPPPEGEPAPPPEAKPRRPPRAAAAKGLRTLCVDIGGTGVKALVVDGEGKPLTERVRVKTPQPATPRAVFGALGKLVAKLEFDRISVGFPGVVIGGVVYTAANLHPSWRGFLFADKLTAKLKRPVRVLNDADVQGYGVVEGKGVEMLITLGTGMGCALFIDGRVVPNLELAHHPLRDGKTYEEYVGARALEKAGKKKWNKHVRRAVEQILPIFNPRLLYIGGGNAKYLTVDLPANVKLVPNVAGLLGGIALWRDQP